MHHLLPEECQLEPSNAQSRLVLTPIENAAPKSFRATQGHGSRLWSMFSGGLVECSCGSGEAYATMDRSLVGVCRRMKKNDTQKS